MTAAPTEHPMSRKQHIPAPGRASGLTGTALCGRGATFSTGDHALIRRLAASGGDHYCAQCLARR